MTSVLSLDPERQRTAKAYARLGRRLFFVDLAVSGLVTLAWLVFGWAAALKGWLITFTHN